MRIASERHCIKIYAWILVGLGFCGCGVVYDIANEEKYTETLDLSLDGAGATLVEARTNNGRIRYTGTDETEVTVRVTKKIRESTKQSSEEIAKQIEVKLERDGERIHISYEKPAFMMGVNVSVEYEIRGPKDLAVYFETSNGAVDVENVLERVKAVTSNGAIDVRECAGELALNTSNGRIDMTGVDAVTEATTSNGAIAFEGQGERVTLRTSNGKIEARVKQLGQVGRFRTSNGAIEVHLPADYSGRLRASTSGGRIEADFPVDLTPEERKKKRWDLQIGEGGDRSVEIETANGGVRLYRLTP